MSTIVFILTVIIAVAGVIFSAIYIWLNAFSSVNNLDERNKSLVNIIRTTLVLPLIFAFVSYLISNIEYIETAIAATSRLYLIITICWIVVLVMWGIAMAFTMLSKKDSSMDTVHTLSKIFPICIIGIIISTVFAWLFG